MNTICHVNKKYNLIQSLNSFILFTENLDLLVFYKTNLIKCLVSRGINFYKENSLSNNITNGFSFSFWFFFSSKKKVIFSLNKQFIRNYKRKLKSILKNNSQNIMIVLNLINQEIVAFSELLFVSAQFSYFARQLDFYIQKRIWRYLKRIYLKRSNIWLYNKFWRKVNGIWQFFILDGQNRITFLKSHFSFNKKSKHLYFSIDVFDYRNRRKFFNDLKFEFDSNTSESLNFLYYRQSGLCFICKRPVLTDRIKLINLTHYCNRNIFLDSTYISHFDCNF